MFRMMNKLKNRKGFTLIELIVVLAVLAIIMAIAVPRFMGVREEAEVDADEATLQMIAKAGELWYVQTNSSASSVPISTLVSTDYMDDFTMQSTSYSGIDTSDDVTFNGEGAATKVGTYNIP